MGVGGADEAESCSVSLSLFGCVIILDFFPRFLCLFLFLFSLFLYFLSLFYLFLCFSSLFVSFLCLCLFSLSFFSLFYTDLVTKRFFFLKYHAFGMSQFGFFTCRFSFRFIKSMEDMCYFYLFFPPQTHYEAPPPPCPNPHPARSNPIKEHRYLGR